jgi:hypothetical protein
MGTRWFPVRANRGPAGFSIAHTISTLPDSVSSCSTAPQPALWWHSSSHDAVKFLLTLVICSCICDICNPAFLCRPTIQMDSASKPNFYDQVRGSECVPCIEPSRCARDRQEQGTHPPWMRRIKHQQLLYSERLWCLVGQPRNPFFPWLVSAGA